MSLEIGCGKFTVWARCREKETIVVTLREEKSFLGWCGYFVQRLLICLADSQKSVHE